MAFSLSGWRNFNILNETLCTLMRIRKFRNSDAVELARLHRSTIRNVNSQDYPKKQIDVWSGRVSVKRFRKSAHENVRFVAIDDEKIIGFADYKKDDLMGLYIHKNYTRKGVGKKLLQRLEKDAYQNGLRTMKCISTITANKFYEKNRYCTIKKTKHQMGNQKLTVYKMKKKLNKPLPSNN